MSLITFNPTQKRQYITTLISLLSAALVMWFGVFILHIYDAIGTKHKIGTFILWIDWLIIAILSFIILKSYWHNHKSSSYKTLPKTLKLLNLLTAILIIIGIFVAFISIYWYFYTIITLRNFTF
jgi:hypothetical protein